MGCCNLSSTWQKKHAAHLQVPVFANDPESIPANFDTGNEGHDEEDPFDADD